MRMLGYILTGGGFILAALVSVQQAGNVVLWADYSAGLLLGIAGVGVLRTVRHRKTLDSAGAKGGSPKALAECISRIVANLAQLRAENASVEASDMPSQIDRLFRSDLEAFVRARESISTSYGLAAYAEVMNEFAAGERYLNRVWSASVDGYVDEVREYLERAKVQFERTEALLRKFTR